MVKKIDHIGIAVKKINSQIKYYEKILGIPCSDIEEVADQQVKVATFLLGDVRIELLEPINQESSVAKFIEKRGEGIHHIAYQVSDLKGQLKTLENENIQLIDRKPRVGAGGNDIAFLHPQSTFGVLTELCEKKE